MPEDKCPNTLSVNELRDLGYLVIVFNPDELREADIGHVEDRGIELINEVIDTLSTE